MTELIDCQLSKNLEAEAKRDSKKPVKTSSGVTEAAASPVRRKFFQWKS